MHFPSATILKKIFLALLCATLGGIVALILVVVVLLENRPDLKVWHEAKLDAEYTADSPVADLNAYRALEEGLFQQLQQKILERIPPTDQGVLNRYYRGSLTNPARWAVDWNRTFELASAKPAAGVLLLHGMSDSPYSLRALGQRLHTAGAWVLGLRLPGHGTVPSGLVDLRWEDMAGAVRLAMRHLADQVKDSPIFLIGYSTGGALAVKYALEQLADDALPPAQKMILISPAMGVSPLAVFSVWQARLGRWLGLDKLAWNSIQPEYNPYKYSSFAINAADQVYRLTAAVRTGLMSAFESGDLSRFPPVLTFQSVVDATVSTPAVLTGLYTYLEHPENDVVVFDINRQTGVLGLLAVDPLDRVKELWESGNMAYGLSLVTNAYPTSRRVVIQHSAPQKTADPIKPLAGQWPDDVHSLSHVALPFPKDDPLYGVAENNTNPGIALSKITLRGEKGVVDIPAAEMLRMKWNPFYPYLERRVLAFLRIQGLMKNKQSVSLDQLVRGSDPNR